MKTSVLLIGLLVAAIALSGCTEPPPAACTMEAKVCPDGTTVGRNPALNCEFDPCRQPCSTDSDCVAFSDGCGGPAECLNKNNLPVCCALAHCGIVEEVKCQCDQDYGCIAAKRPAESIPLELLNQDCTNKISKPKADLICHDRGFKYVDWSLTTESDAVEIANKFIENHEDILDVSLTGLKVSRVPSSISPPVEYAVWYNQYYENIPVYYGKLAVHLNGYGAVTRIQWEIATGITAPLTPAISEAQALELLKQHYANNELESLLGEELKLYIYDNKLAWRANIDLPVGKEVFVDAQSGEIILERQNWVS